MQVFIRKNAAGPIDSRLLLFYVTHPVREIKGIANFKQPIVGEVEELWRKYDGETVFQFHDEYLDFMQGRTKATFIRFENLHELVPPIPLKKALQTIGISQLPLSGKYLSEETTNKLLRG